MKVSAGQTQQVSLGGVALTRHKLPIAAPPALCQHSINQKPDQTWSLRVLRRTDADAPVWVRHAGLDGASVFGTWGTESLGGCVPRLRSVIGQGTHTVWFGNFGSWGGLL